jgi:predicted alpha/beta hydrolase
MTGREMAREAHRIPAEGATLVASEFPAAGVPRGVVVVGHAMMCDRATLDRPSGKGLASTLAAAGLHVYTFDLRGHGESVPRAAAGGQWQYDDIVNGDIPAVTAWARARHPGLRLGFLGHSLAGHAALLRLGQDQEGPIDALAVYAANVWLRRHEPSTSRWLKKRAVLALWLLVTRTVGHFPARLMRAGTDDETVGLVADLHRFAVEDRCIRASDGADYLEGRARVRQPVLAYAGEADTLLGARESCARFVAPVPNHRLETVPGATHMSLVLSQRSRPTWEATARWFIEVLGT